MKKLFILAITLMTSLFAISLTADEDKQYTPNRYYDPQPAVKVKCNGCENGRGQCRYAQWHTRTEKELGKVVEVCNEFDECIYEVVPSTGKKYHYFTWSHRQHICY